MEEMLAAGVLFAVLLILLSLVKIYRVDRFWVLYQTADGAMHTGSFTFSHHGANDLLLMDAVKDVVCEDESVTIVALEVRGYGYRVGRAD